MHRQATENSTETRRASVSDATGPLLASLPRKDWPQQKPNSCPTTPGTLQINARQCKSNARTGPWRQYRCEGRPTGQYVETQIRADNSIDRGARPTLRTPRCGWRRYLRARILCAGAGAVQIGKFANFQAHGNNHGVNRCSGLSSGGWLR
jgi:hypothetical protein